MNFKRNPNTNSITFTFDSGRVSDLKNALDFAIDNDNSLGISDVIDPVSYTHLTLPTILRV